MEKVILYKNAQAFDTKILLASSKSESNRALIINALSGFKGDLKNLSSARDTQTMIRLLQSADSVADVIDAGTTMRFLTAYFTATNQNKTMTGTPRMCERPIGILVEALKTIGADIEYLKTEGYPPLHINGLSAQKSSEVTIRGDVSSQYISALLMIAPTLPQGLTICLTGEIGSIPYINMTLAQMKAFGVDAKADWDAKVLTVASQQYKPTSYQVESDWSGASYWYSIVALSTFEDTRVELLGLKENSLQGDSAIVAIMTQLGVKSTFTADGVLLTKIPAQPSLQWDFANCPDLAQTVAVTCVAKGIEAVFTGIESLKIKETDRILALQNELKKFGGSLTEVVTNTEYRVSGSGFEFGSAPVSIATYDDHRMAMAFAPLAMLTDVTIEEPNVVVKSYPSFWDDIKKIVEIERQPAANVS
ncbi:3-phosphoshikimate 1-carboxyvinyltransferase [Emticicia sp. 21SJ11W-3]|uniref:3-phosphoshikimate 1-carboxyvinyltransferase n=1 Tax=Emticicia sp. 21SJ11W-3 TaxID=2916755 RepID=UPI00209C9C3A|nr:3-phosphoshikimate 1-carboxyvinyltransferase [Emticicia sp. 21SJ11W-3]UTA69911.1 3-phosphoshikimate 1-carboxyvinyltransferase [Emticicia sp. 21SJ11W-3]